MDAKKPLRSSSSILAAAHATAAAAAVAAEAVAALARKQPVAHSSIKVPQAPSAAVQPSGGKLTVLPRSISMPTRPHSFKGVSYTPMNASTNNTSIVARGTGIKRPAEVALNFRKSRLIVTEDSSSDDSHEDSGSEDVKIARDVKGGKDDDGSSKCPKDSLSTKSSADLPVRIIDPHLLAKSSHLKT